MDNNNVFSSVPANGVVCPACGTANNPGSNFCITCGLPFTAETTVPAPKAASTDVFEKEAAPETAAPATPAPAAKPAVIVKQPVQEPEIEIPNNALAQTLPSWDLEPPQVVVRRKR